MPSYVFFSVQGEELAVSVVHVRVVHLHRLLPLRSYQSIYVEHCVLLPLELEILERECRLHRHEERDFGSKRELVLRKLISVQRLFQLADLFGAEREYLKEGQEGLDAERVILTEPYTRC